MTPGALRADPGFRRYLAARVVSMVGTLITAVVLPVLVYRLTGSAGWTAAVVAVEALPHLVLAPLAARVVRRLNARNLLFTADLAGAALLATVPLAWWSGDLSGWQVLAVAGAIQAAFVLRDRASSAALPALFGPEMTAAANNARREATDLVALMVPPLAGLAVAIVRPAPLLILGALSFLASALLVRAAVRTRPDPTRPDPTRPVPTEPTDQQPAEVPRHPVRSGLRFLRERPGPRALTLAGTLHAAAAGAYLAMLLPWADQHLGVPPWGDARLALLISCWGLGAMIGRALYPTLRARIGPLRLDREALLASLAFGLGMLASTNWLPAVLTGLLWGAGYTVATRAGMDAVGTPARAATRMLRAGGLMTGAALAGAVATLATPRAGLAVGIGLLVLAEFAARRAAAPVRPPVHRGPATDEHPDGPLNAPHPARTPTAPPAR
ncbi:MAG TPA: MFS transporter [Pseudonocardiaceae bacterium]